MNKELSITLANTIDRMSDRSIKFTMMPDTNYWFLGLPKKLKPRQLKSYWLSQEELDWLNQQEGRPISDTEWEKYCSELGDLGDYAPIRIVGSGKRGRQRKHLGQIPDLYRQFAKIDNGLDLLDFIKKYGPLTDEKGGDDAENLLDQAKEMRHLIARADKFKRPQPASISDLKATV